MDIAIKNKIIKLRKQDKTYSEVKSELLKSGIKMSTSRIKIYEVSRIPTEKLSVNQQLEILNKNAHEIAHLIRDSLSIYEAYESLKIIDNGCSIMYYVFLRYLSNNGGYKNIKVNEEPLNICTSISYRVSKNVARILTINKDLILQNLDKTYQNICDLLQDKTNSIVDPGALSAWCHDNNIEKSTVR